VAPCAGVRSVITGAEVEADHEGPLRPRKPDTSPRRTTPRNMLRVNPGGASFVAGRMSRSSRPSERKLARDRGSRRPTAHEDNNPLVAVHDAHVAPAQISMDDPPVRLWIEDEQ